jgi:tRNA 2-thiouridine synthesizing protein A
MSDPIPLDLRGLKCPLPALKTRKALTRLVSGQRLLVETTDPLAVIDIPHVCQETGDRLIGQQAGDGVHRFTIEKA